MRIGLDITPAARSGGTGIARYTVSLLRGLCELGPENEYYLYCKLRSWSRMPQLELDTRAKLHRRPLLWTATPLLLQGSLDIFHSPDLRLPQHTRRNGPYLVATVHDVFSAVSDRFAEEKFRKKKLRQYRHTAEAADLIIAVSRTTRNDLVRFFPQAGEKSVVIYEGVDERFWQPPPPVERRRILHDELRLPERYFLFVGNLTERKNVARLVEAFSRFAGSNRERIFLVLAGRESFGRERIMDAIAKAKHRDRIIRLGYIAHHRLPALYRGAIALVFPTLYEGFGLPIVEAMASGCPVITSNRSANAEIASDAAYLVEPEDTDAIASAMYEVATDGALRDRLIERGRERARIFSWKKTARHTLAAYAELLRTGRKNGKTEG